MTQLTQCVSHLGRTVFPLIVAAAFTIGQAKACGFHYYIPENTSVDRLLQSKDVILARPSRQNRFEFEATKVLRGQGPSQKLPFLVSTVLRKKMELNPQDHIVLERAPEGTWKHVSYANAAYVEMVKSVLANSETWSRNYTPDRFAMFAKLLNSPDPALKELALREVDKAPYEMLRQIDVNLSSEDLLSQLWTIKGIPFQSIRILLLGLSGDDAARVEIHRFIDTSKDKDRAENLGAFSAALVEMDGLDGVTRLETTYLTDTSQPLAKLEQVVEALAIHNAVASFELHKAITDALSQMILQRPETAPMVARQFGNRQDWSQGETVALALKNKAIKNPAEQFMVASYVSRAQRVQLSNREDN
ncbi:hypothetical protein J7426_18305 [Tropicibacter sp. R16_0]|uniref:hypothetical protein n=1 Tax=Tropicibacter sp. R16_0 TaxID=2821102 RepID=UPI001ADCF147|nr:hypothetical protein [Tropicibacter sp. R16_0]MBO9452232.1 hypothetical protein [Tropicibacter sp. R16_0]